MTAGPDELEDTVAVRLTADQVAQLADLLRGDGLRTLQFDTVKGRFAVSLGQSEAAAKITAEPGGRRTETVCAASVGEFLTGYPTRMGSLVRQGARVSPGDVLGLVRTGLVFSPVILPANDPRPAILTRTLVPTGTIVGYGTALFELERD